MINIGKRTLTVVWYPCLTIRHRVIPLTLNDHVVQDHTTLHHLPHVGLRLSHSWVPDNGKSRLQRTKCSLDILPASLPALRKPSFRASCHSLGDGLHKCCPLGVDAICKIVALCVLVSVDLIVHCGAWLSTSSAKTSEHFNTLMSL